MFNAVVWVSADAVGYPEAGRSRLDRLVEQAYEAVEQDAERFFANQDAGPTTVVEEGRITVYADGSCRYQAVQPYGEATHTSRQVPLDTDWTRYCEEVYAPLAAAASTPGRIPTEVLETVTRLDPASGEGITAGDVAPVRTWLTRWEAEPVEKQVVYRG